MIDVKQAVARVLEYARELYPSDQTELTLEEIERSDDGAFWHITLGIVDRSTPFAVLQGPRAHRDYKVFKVDGERGDVVSMKIRSVSDEP